jgi:hypothetical protein
MVFTSPNFLSILLKNLSRNWNLQFIRLKGTFKSRLLQNYHWQLWNHTWVPKFTRILDSYRKYWILISGILWNSLTNIVPTHVHVQTATNFIFMLYSTCSTCKLYLLQRQFPVLPNLDVWLGGGGCFVFFFW